MDRRVRLEGLLVGPPSVGYIVVLDPGHGGDGELEGFVLWSGTGRVLFRRRRLQLGHVEAAGVVAVGGGAVQAPGQEEGGYQRDARRYHDKAQHPGDDVPHPGPVEVVLLHDRGDCSTEAASCSPTLTLYRKILPHAPLVPRTVVDGQPPVPEPVQGEERHRGGNP